MGILFSLLAMVSWGVGDFLLQRSTKKNGKFVTLFFVTGFASIVLLPFVFSEIPSLFQDTKTLLLYTLTSVIMLGATLMVLQAMKIGKLAVVEPLNTIELPVTVLLAVILLGERLSVLQTAYIGVLIIGMFLLSTQSFRHLRHIHVEKGVGLALLGNAAMGIADFLFLFSAREGSPLLLNWFTSTVMCIVSLVIISRQKRISIIPRLWDTQKFQLLLVSILDNVAWLSYSYAAIYISVSLTTGISESYIAIGALLGVIINKERLKTFQWLGLLITFCAAMLLITTI